METRGQKMAKQRLIKKDKQTNNNDQYFNKIMKFNIGNEIKKLNKKDSKTVQYYLLETIKSVRWSSENQNDNN